MKTIFFRLSVFFFFLLSSYSAIECNPYVDSTDKTPVDVDTCAKLYINQDNTKFTATSPCKSNKCKWQTSLQCDNSLLYPGDKCTQDAECNSNSCKNGFCLDKGQGLGCLTNIDCNPGYFCDKASKLCSSQKNIDAACTSDYECLNSLVCNNQVCKKLFSVDTDGVCSVSDSQLTTGWSWACKSTFCKDSKCVSSTSLPSNTNKGSCKEDVDCGLSDKTTGVCGCTYDQKGSAKCKVQPGDYLWKEVITYFQDFVNPLLEQTQGKCHTERRFQYECYKDQFGNNQRLLTGFQVYDVKRSEAFDINGGQFTDLSTNTFKAFLPESLEEYQNTYFTDACYKYQCASKKLQKDQCIDFNTDTFNIDNVCDDDYYCPNSVELKNQTCSKISKSVTKDKVPGDSCKYENNCKEGLSCKNGRCSGFAKGTKCDNENDLRCDIGLACIQDTTTSQFTCQDQVKNLNKCKSDYQCENDCLCVYETCRKYLTIEADVIVTGECNPATITNDVCENRQCGTLGPNSFKCVAPLVSSASIPSSANFDGKCAADNGEL